MALQTWVIHTTLLPLLTGWKTFFIMNANNFLVTLVPYLIFFFFLCSVWLRWFNWWNNQNKQSRSIDWQKRVGCCILEFWPVLLLLKYCGNNYWLRPSNSVVSRGQIFLHSVRFDWNSHDNVTNYRCGWQTYDASEFAINMDQ